MDNLTFTLSSGHVVTLKKSLSYRAERAITAALLGDMPLRVKAGDADSLRDQKMEIKYSNIQAYQDEALRHLLVSVLDPEKNVAADPYEAVMEMDATVADEVMAKVSELTQSKKKSKTSS